MFGEERGISGFADVLSAAKFPVRELYITGGV